MIEFEVTYFNENLEEVIIRADLIEVMGNGNLVITNSNEDEITEIKFNQLMKIESVL